MYNGQRYIFSAHPPLQLHPKVPHPHGRLIRTIRYMDDWKNVDVPSWTYLLYVDTTGQYRCTVEDSTVLFHVQGL